MLPGCPIGSAPGRCGPTNWMETSWSSPIRPRTNPQLWVMPSLGGNRSKAFDSSARLLLQESHRDRATYESCHDQHSAGADGLGGAAIVQKAWDRRYLQYFVALGAGFMLGTALLEMLPESFRVAGPSAPLLVLTGYFIVHFFEHTVTSHFHFGEETHAEEFVEPHRGYSVLF